jgi:hypothetical protein
MRRGFELRIYSYQVRSDLEVGRVYAASKEAEKRLRNFGKVRRLRQLQQLLKLVEEHHLLPYADKCISILRYKDTLAYTEVPGHMIRDGLPLKTK